jgi:AraC family ethanolamine operon transcriptional activator
MASAMPTPTRAKPTPGGPLQPDKDALVTHEATLLSPFAPGQNLEYVRRVPGGGASTIREGRTGGLHLSRIEFGFPTMSRAELDEHTAVLARIEVAPSGGHWNHNAIEAGQVRSLGPGAHHLGTEPAGLSILLVFFAADTLAETADTLGLDARATDLRGPLPRSARLDEALDLAAQHLDDAAADFAPHATRDTQRLLAAVAGALPRGAALDDRVPLGSRHSAQVVNRCIDYVDSISIYVPSIVELVTVAGVSERRLRAAFVEQLEVPPIRYFRARGLRNARTQLRSRSPDTATVTDIAHSLGFTHMSRFARQYRQLFAETPAQTLRTHRPAGSRRSLVTRGQGA